MYPSDISRGQFEQINPLLEDVRKQTKPCGALAYMTCFVGCRIC